jgi:hypothetical protein
MFRGATLRALFLFVLPPFGTNAQQISISAESNVFQLHGSVYGSAFTVQVEGREYLITAKHVVQDFRMDGSTESIEIRKLGRDEHSHELTLRWQRLAVKIFGSSTADVAVLVLEQPLRDAAALKPRTGQIAMGQDIYFLGFPLGIAMPVGGINEPFPVPFVKRGILSNADGTGFIYFDGYNNPGFSGGPVVYRAFWGKDADPSHFYVAAVITGCIPELTHVARWRAVRPNEDLSSVEKWRIMKARGRTEVLEDTTAVVPLNSGIVVATSIDRVLDLIKLHPVGPLVRTQP